jgi:predicted N-acyltransferase
MNSDLIVTEESIWSRAESDAFGNPLLDHAAAFIPASRRSTRLTLAKVRRGDRLIGVAPVLVLRRYRATRLLRPDIAARYDPVFGRAARTTQCLVETSFMGYLDEEPFFAREASDRAAVRAAVIAHLQARRDIHTLLVTEPAENAPAVPRGFDAFLQLPLIRTETAGFADYDAWLAAQGAKRRRNARAERRLLDEAGARIEVHGPDMPRALRDRMHKLLINSARANADGGFVVPYEIMMNDYESFLRQQFHALSISVGGRMAGFFAFIPRDGVMHQVHGGLDYEIGPEIKAYPNLMHAAIGHAIRSGFRAVTFGPRNNEAKRRAGTEHPVRSALWCRSALRRIVARRMMDKLHVYTGPA